MTSREMNKHYKYDGENVKDLSIEEIFPTVIDNVVINLIDDHCTLFLPPDMTGMQFGQFMNGKGGVMSMDYKNFLEGKPHGKYAIFEHERGRAVIRFVEDDEWLKFEVSKLIHGKVKDRSYTVVRELEEGEEIKTTRVCRVPIPETVEEEIAEETLEENEPDFSSSVPLFKD